MIKIEPYFFSLVWVLFYMSLNIPIGFFLTSVIIIINALSLLYFTLVAMLTSGGRNGKYSDEFKNLLKRDMVLPLFLCDGIISLVLSIIFFFFFEIGKIGIMGYLFLTAGSVNFLFFCELTLHIYSHYLTILKNLYK